MEKYIIADIQFDNKEQVRKKIRKVVKESKDFVPLSKNDKLFMNCVFAHDEKFDDRIKDKDYDIYFAPHKEYTSVRCAYISYAKSDIPTHDISWVECVNKMKKIDVNRVIIDFGKYIECPKTVKEVLISDPGYVKWMIGKFEYKGKKNIKILTEIKQQMLIYEHNQETTNNITTNNITTINKMTTNNTLTTNDTMTINPNQTTMKLEYLTDKKQKRFTKRVAQYNLEGILMKTYDSVQETEDSGYSAFCVSKCINNKIKLHKKCIFMKIKNGKDAETKIDASPYLVHMSKTKVNDNKEKVSKETITIKPKGMRIGMFNKQKKLLQVFTNIDQITNKFGHTSGVYDHLYGKVKKKSGYNNLYFFKELNVGQTYTINEKYDFKQFKKAIPKKIKKNIVPVQETKMVPMENTIIPVEELKTILTEEPIKRNFFQRLKYLITG